MSVIHALSEWFLNRARPVTIELGTRWFRLMAGSCLDHRLQLAGRTAVPAPGQFLLSSRIPHAIFDLPSFHGAVRALFDNKIPRETYISVVLPDQAFFLGTISISSVALRTNPQGMVEREIQNTAPLSVKEYHFVFEAGVTVGSKSQVHFCALPRGILADLEEGFHGLGIIPLSIQPSVIGLIHLLKTTGLEPSTSPSVLLHFGQECATFVIFSNAGLKRIQSVPIGGIDLNQALCRKGGMTPDQAEEFKNRQVILLEDPASEAQAEIEAYRFLEPLFVDLLQRLYAFLQSYIAEFPNESNFQRVVLSGGSSCLRHLDKLIAANLGIPVTSIGTLVEASDRNGPCATNEKAEWAPVLGDLAMEPWRLDRFDRVASA